MQEPENLFSSFFSMIFLTYLLKSRISINYKSKKKYILTYCLIIFFSIKLFLLNTLGLFSLPILNKQQVFLKSINPNISDITLKKITNSLSFPILENHKSRLILVKPFLSQYILNHTVPSDGILTIGKNNIYNFFYNKTPIKNSLLYWHYGVTFNENISKIHYYNPENIFSKINFIEFDFTTHNETSTKFFKIYEPFILKNFVLVYSDKSSKIYKKINASK
jgi:hypothetical protein